MLLRPEQNLPFQARNSVSQKPESSETQLSSLKNFFEVTYHGTAN
jgi:hypothetical protein